MPRLSFLSALFSLLLASRASALIAPSSFTATALSATSINWTWVDNSTDEVNYRVIQGTVSNISGNLAANTTGWLQTGLSANTQYGPYMAEAVGVASTTADSSSLSRYTLANAPSSLAFTSVSTTAISISWSANGNPGGTWYNIQRSTGAGYTTVSSGTSTSYTDLSVSTSATFSYQVDAQNGESVATSFTGPISTTPSVGTAPAAPTGFAGAAQSASSILWSWTDNASNETGYRVLSGTINVSGDMAANTTSWLQTGLSVNTQYGAYLAQAFNSSGTANSGGASKYTLANAPAALAFTSVSTSAISISWSANGNPGITVFNVQRSTGAGYVTVSSGTSTTYTDTSVTSSSTYSYQVDAQNGDAIATSFTGPVSTTTGSGSTTPAAPTGFAGTAQSGTSILWSWTDNASNETGYRVLSGTINVSGDMAANTTTWLQTGLSINTQYGAYLAQAFNSSGTANSGSASKYTLANAPSSLAFTSVSTSAISISWSANGNPGITVFNVQRSTGAGYVTVSSGTSTSYTDVSVSTSATFSYQVDAQNGNAIATSFTGPISTAPSLGSPPAAPSGFAGTAQSGTSILWSWTDNANNELGYRVLSGTINVSGDMAANTTSWLQTGLTANTQYGAYLAQAFNSSGTANSSSASKYTLANVPGSFGFTSVLAGQISLSWTANGSAGSPIYELQRSTGAGFTTISSGTATSYTDNAVSPSSSYQYQVRAYNGDSIATAYTGAISTTTPAAATGPTAPSGFAGTAQSASSILWSWTDNATTETGYRVLSGTINVSGDMAANTTTWLQTGLSVNTQYGAYLAQAFNSTGTANSGSASRYTLANAPSSLAFTSVLAGQISISWSANGNPGSTLFEVQRSTGGAFSVVSSGTATSYSDLAVSPSSNYQYEVRAYNGDSAATAFAGPISTTTPAAATGPTAPSGFAGAAQSASSILWSWTDNASNETGYRVLSGTINVSGDMAANTTTWLQTGLSANTQYGAYLAQAFNSTGTANSGSASRYTLANVPGSLAFTSVQSNQIALSWTANGNAGSPLYEVQRSTGAGFTTISSGTATSYTDNAVSASTAYQYQVRAYNGDSIATAFAGPISTTTPAAPAPPAAPTAFAGTAASTSAITWTWTDNASNETGYRVMSGATNLSGNLAANTVSWTQTGLSPNTAYGPYNAEAFNGSGTADSSTGTIVYTLAVPPTGTAAGGVQAQSVTLTWSQGADPASTVAEVQRSTNGATYAQMLLSPATYFLDTSVIGCTTYYYRVREQNGAGVSTAFDSVVQLLTPNTVPHAALGLTAVSLPGNKISLSWTPSPTEGITGYRLFYDNGSGTVNYGAPLAVLTSTESSYTTGLLISSAAYTFALRADHRCGTEETNGVMAIAGSTGTLANVRAVITSPDAGKHINGNSVTVVADLSAGTFDQVSQISFQFRASGTTNWMMIPAASINHPNPDVDAPYFIQWNVTTGLTPGNYDLRAVAVNVAGSSDTAPAAITVTVDPVTPDINESVVGGAVQKQQKVDTTVTNTIGASGAAANAPVAKIVVPPGALSGSTVTATVVINPVITTAPPAGLSTVGSMLQIDLDNGQHQLAGGSTAKLTMSYPATVTDPSTLQLYSLNTQTGQWTKDFASTVDVTSRTVTGFTPHFSVFAIFAGAPAAADLSNVRVYPVPYKPHGGNPDEGKPFSAGDFTTGIIFDNLPSPVKIEIFTMTGRRVAKFDQSTGAGLLHWDARNDDGRDVASGGYFAVISSPGHKSVVKKLAIIR